MPVVAAVLHAHPDHVADLALELAQDDRITVGEPVDGRLPVVGDTASRREDKQLWRAIESRVDVRLVELAIADFSDIHMEVG